MKNIIVALGTRPEAIKMCPLIAELKKRKNINVRVVSTGQHREMLAPVLGFFGVASDFELDVMSEGQTLFDVTERVMRGMRKILDSVKCDLLLVHGDTTTAFAAALSAFYMNIPVGHVEAGLRTYDIRSPYPEEFNRNAIDAVSDLLFAPTENCAERLVSEGRKKENIFVTGNTAVDALKYTLRDDFTHPLLEGTDGKRILLITAHRRENSGEKMKAMFRGIVRAVEEYSDVCAIYPVHPNPSVRGAAHEIFGMSGGIKLTEPLCTHDFHNILARSYIAVTDSGGIQEEAPCLGVPVLVMRDTTERTEALESGGVKLIGTDERSVYEGICALLSDGELHGAMSHAGNCYGDGDACVKIADIIERI